MSDHEGAVRLLSRLVFGFGAVAGLLIGVLAPRPTPPALRELVGSGLLGTGLAAVLIGLAGLSAALAIASARLDWALQLERRRRWGRILAPGELLGRAARRPQGIIVPAFCLAALLALWGAPPAGARVGASATILGAATLACAFPFLLAQRFVAAMPTQTLPEADALSALLRVPVLALALGGVIEVAAGQGVPGARVAAWVLAAGAGLVALELGVRALANWFLPPPPPEAARAAVTSLLAHVLQAGSSGKGLAAPIQAQLGIDFSRSWALRFLRSAALPVAALIALVGWGLTGAALVPLDHRAIYERFGAPVAVWQPGAHLGLPWPLGRVRLVDLGIVHVMTLGGTEATETRPGAEDPAPESANRLWDRPHPAETSYVIAATEAGGAPSFQSVDADLKVAWRIGLDDRSARRAAYGAVSPEALVRTETGRLLSALFARSSLETVIGADRERLATELRDALQRALDRSDSGIAVMAVVIEAIHPPLAAARAYQDVQAAEIVANTAIAVERGKATTRMSTARQSATSSVDAAKGQASDTVSASAVRLRDFTADTEAAKSGGRAFLLERYFANLRAALPRAPLVILDHRLEGAGAPTLDLRPYGAPPTRAEDD